MWLRYKGWEIVMLSMMFMAQCNRKGFCLSNNLHSSSSVKSLFHTERQIGVTAGIFLNANIYAKASQQLLDRNETNEQFPETVLLFIPDQFSLIRRIRSSPQFSFSPVKMRERNWKCLLPHDLTFSESRDMIRHYALMRKMII